MPDATQIPVACFAPPFSDDLLKTYAKLVNELPKNSELRDALATMLDCLESWWKLPESKTKRSKDWEFKKQDGTTILATEQPLDDDHVAQLWDNLPYMRELVAMEPLLDAIPTSDKELRDCAFHLLWACKELTLDREPMTIERLK